MAAHFDEEWPNGGELSLFSEHVVPQKDRSVPAVAAELLLEDELPDGTLSPAEKGTFRSMEALVKDFDEKLSVCFQNYNTKTESIASVNVLSEDTLLEKDDIWSALTCNYGQVMAVDWKQSRVCSLHTATFNLEDKARNSDVTAELSDDEELREQLDMHSIIISSLTEEPLFTAEQVIEEIEEMMQDSPDMDTEHNPSQSDLSMLSVDIQRIIITPHYEERIRTMTVAELNERLEQTETTISRFSEELVQQLALRDELDFEKEVKNSFISALIDVQNRQKEHREMLKKKKKLKGAAGTLQSHNEKSFGSVSTEVLDP